MKLTLNFSLQFLIEEYIKGIKDPSGKLITTSRRKTGFIGFLVAIKSIQALYNELVTAPSPKLKYLLTYKFSQDHLELFFAAVRSAGGWNNNPTTSQFMASYKQLLMRHTIERGQGNCKPQDDTKILDTIEDQCNVNSLPTGTLDISIARRYDLQLRQPATIDHDYCDVSNAIELSEYKEAAISYIAGFVAKMAKKEYVARSVLARCQYQVIQHKCHLSPGRTMEGLLFLLHLFLKCAKRQRSAR